MLIRAKDIINSRVVNRSGCYLGRVVDFDLDNLTQSVKKYYIQGNILGFFKKPLIIDSSQVIKIKKDEIIVDDAVIQKKITKKEADSIEYAK